MPFIKNESLQVLVTRNILKIHGHTRNYCQTCRFDPGAFDCYFASSPRDSLLRIWYRTIGSISL